jgi:thiopeptide-type bacteriocin biosynthesis protein
MPACCSRDAEPWRQVNIAYLGETPEGRERLALDHLTQAVSKAESRGLVHSWFFLRKGHWRVRYLPAPGAADEAQAVLTRGTTWTPAIYEPEVHAFGGPEAMSFTHALWHADSHNILTNLPSRTHHRRELSLILLTTLMRAAGLDLYEQGDVWFRTAHHRPLSPASLPTSSTWTDFIAAVRQLLMNAPAPDSALITWTGPFVTAGRSINALSQAGVLTRGPRAVLVHHALFHWNRLGLPYPAQAILARAAQEAIFSGCRPSDSPYAGQG